MINMLRQEKAIAHAKQGTRVLESRVEEGTMQVGNGQWPPLIRRRSVSRGG